MSLYLPNHWLIADQRFRLGVAVALPCVVLALAWRSILTAKDRPKEEPPSTTEKPSTQAPTHSSNPPTTTKTTVTNITRAPSQAPRAATTVANTYTPVRAAPAVPPKAAAVRAPRTHRTAPEKKPEEIESERSAKLEEKPTSKPKPKPKPRSTNTTTTTTAAAAAAAEPITPLATEHEHQYYPQPHQSKSQYPVRHRHEHQHQEPDSLSISSGGSSEHHPSNGYKNRTLRVGKNLKRAWSKRPFAGNSDPATAASPAAVHGGKESILFPESPGAYASNSAGFRG